MRAPNARPCEVEHLPHPILAIAKDYAHGARVAWHSHARAQLLFATSGTMRVTTAAGAWIVPPLRAVWIPPGTEHALAMTGPVSMRTLFLRPGAAPFMPGDCCRVVEVTPLLRALILAAMEEDSDPELPPTSRAGMIAGLIVSELERAEPVPCAFPCPATRGCSRSAAPCSTIPPATRRWRTGPSGPGPAAARSPACS
ncbi:AraC family ligand binding domain-containing protein [Azospirillum thermophilum]|uniref:AraC family ligand binding domain-containing protein n=1 Tax=Azospirillum thermophilum TaxID=2202148 RepID=UPI001FEB1873|nr:AraC family ligand binding domain-containing protein [Azospirillum thermophilum]